MVFVDISNLFLKGQATLFNMTRERKGLFNHEIFIGLPCQLQFHYWQHAYRIYSVCYLIIYTVIKNYMERFFAHFTTLF